MIDIQQEQTQKTAYTQKECTTNRTLFSYN